MSARPVFLDWRSGQHASERAKPCVYCGQPTNLRDDERRPAHKVCAEAALTKEARR